jgi:hypothetical protein
MHDRAERRHTHWRQVSRRAHLLAEFGEPEREIVPGALDTEGRLLRRPRARHPEVAPSPDDWEGSETENPEVAPSPDDWEGSETEN